MVIYPRRPVPAPPVQLGALLVITCISGRTLIHETYFIIYPRFSIWRTVSMVIDLIFNLQVSNCCGHLIRPTQWSEPRRSCPLKHRSFWRFSSSYRPKEILELPVLTLNLGITVWPIPLVKYIFLDAIAYPFCMYLTSPLLLRRPIAFRCNQSITGKYSYVIV